MIINKSLVKVLIHFKVQKSILLGKSEFSMEQSA